MSVHPLPLPQHPPLPPPPPYHPHLPFPPFASPYTSPFFYPGFYPNHGTNGHWAPEPSTMQPNLYQHQPQATSQPSLPQKQPTYPQPILLPPPIHTHDPTHIPVNQKQPTPPPPSTQHPTQEATKQPNTIHIDNKFFQFSLGGGRIHPFCITERKFKTTLGKIWLGLKDMGWLGNTMEMAASNDTVGKDFFRHHRDGYKAIHVIRRSNQHGQYLEVSEFHSGARKGVIRIPAGLEKQGWKQFAFFCKGHQNNQVLSTNDRRRVVVGAAVTEKEVEGSKPKIMHNDHIFQTHVTAAVKSAVGSISADTNKDVNAHVVLNLKLELMCGPDGEWAISRAEVIKNEPNPNPLLKPVTKPVGPVSRPVSRQEWRPKTQPPQAFHKTVPEASTKASSSTSAIPPSPEKTSDPIAAPSSADDEAVTWVMQLRQGKRLFMPQPPPLPLSPNPFYALSTELFTDSSEKIEIPEIWSDDNPAHTSSMIVPESTQIIGEDDGGWDEHVEWIEPLAVAYPAVELNGESEVQESSVQREVPEVIPGPQSDWVMEKMEEFGVVLGASYVGFEDRVLALLREIEAETGGSKTGGGLNDRVKRSRICNLLHLWKADVVCFQETKLMAVSQGLIRSLWRCRYVDWLSLDSVGASGGIILMWDKRVVDRVDVAIGHFSVSCRFREVATGFEWAFSGVYGPNRAVERSLMWEELAGIASWWEVPWCVGGDFNIVRYPSERVGATDFSPSMREFTDFIFSMGLLDLPMDGGNFTWSNARSKSRLDRFLCSPLLADHFSRIAQRRLPRLLSDHFPILLSCGFMQKRRSPFRFENMWLRSEGFHNRVQQWWNSYLYNGSPSYILIQKLKSLKVDLRRWNKEIFGDVNLRKNDLQAQIQDLDLVEETRTLSVEEGVIKENLKADFEKLLLLEEIKWRQTSRATWLREGDKNTKIFHRVANSNCRFNSFDHLMVNGAVSTDQSEIGKGLVDFYKGLFSDNEVRRPLLDGVAFSSIDEADRDMLDRSFTEDEVWGVVRNMAGDKAPGPDGFSLAFFQSCWDIIKQDVMNVFHDFHVSRNFVKSLNVTFLALIPKKPGAQECKDFRPISLVTGMYKIIAKVLANRLSGVLPKLISASQNAFVGGRQILDSVLVANESLDSRLKSGFPGVLCKLDIEKAYDHVNWNFLLYMLRRCGFSERWRQWIYSCISTVRFSVLVNGSAHGFFSTSRGLRQGDPLSPMLFIIVMEALSRMLERAVAGGYISGFSVGNSTGVELSISHSLFADDTLIFCGANSEQAWYLRGVFIWFQAISGLKINLSKSELVPVGQVTNVPELAGILGCRVASLPLTYLGLPLGASYKSKSIWVGVVEKMEKREDFLWGGLEEEHKFHLVNWHQTCTPLHSGGLGIRDVAIFNKALLGKWLWRYSMEPTSLWRQVIDSKYGSQGNFWCSNRVNSPHGVSLWKHIRAGWDVFSQHISYTVGDGSRLRFWHDVWCGDLPLRSQFPSLFQLARAPEATVADLCHFQGMNCVWDIAFIRSVQDWELEMIDSFMTLLYSSRIRQGVADSLCWTPSSRGLFEVRSFYSTLIHPFSQDSFPWKGVWKAKVPPRVAFFVWTSALGKILTTDNPQKKEAWELWSMVLILFGITWVMPRGVVDLFNCWHGPRSKSEAGKIWKMTPHCLMWCIWQERNDRTFNGVEKSIPALKFHLLHILLSWAKAAHLDSSCSLSDMIDYCSKVDTDYGLYYCSECNFVARLDCANKEELKDEESTEQSVDLAAYEVKKHNVEKDETKIVTEIKHFGHEHDLKLSDEDCNGFTHHCKTCNFDLDVQCSLMLDILTHEGHEHRLMLSNTPYRQTCNGCDSKRYNVFRCTTCGFALDFKCATLPLTARYEQHEHPFTLCYTAEDDSGEYYCDICEEERNPKHWFYYCANCSYPTHPKCILGEEPNVKKDI
uniref:Reverse transcriptase domain-containing protein n=1 Tax=Fagus sylvatica TaxID=28930 RepID=A0A2N9EUU7_FAGSY